MLLFMRRAMSYFKKAADLGDKRAQQRLKGPPIGQQGVPPRDGSDPKNAATSKDCVIM
jgi:hypothetical protein